MFDPSHPEQPYLPEPTDERPQRLLADTGIEAVVEDGRVVFRDRLTDRAPESPPFAAAADQSLDIVSGAGARFGWGPFTADDHAFAMRHWGIQLAATATGAHR